MECKHLHLTKVANMNPKTYRCDECHDLFDVTLGAVAMPRPVMGISHAILFALALFSGCSGNFVYAQATATFHYHGQAVLPDPHETPGMPDLALTKEKLCDPAFRTGTVRNVPRSEKVKACLAYGVTTECPGKGYELDHLISIELGGSNDIKNLWPQPIDAGGVIGFHTKDVVENRAHRAVCAGEVELWDAQESIARDWYAFGLKHGWITPKK